MIFGCIILVQCTVSFWYSATFHNVSVKFSTVSFWYSAKMALQPHKYRGDSHFIKKLKPLLHCTKTIHIYIYTIPVFIRADREH